MIEILKKIAISNLINKNSGNKPSAFLNWDRISSILLIIDDKQLNKNQLDVFLESLNKHIEIYFIDSNAKVPAYSDFKSVLAKDLNWMGMPKNIKSGNYDLIINACPQNNTAAIALSVVNKAKVKCSMFDYREVYNLMIQPKANLIDNLKEMVHYLKMITN
jgi:hypothetical protein